MKKKFNNKENIPHKINNKIVWESRSVTVLGTILVECNGELYILAGKRGMNNSSYPGYYNLISGYLDWNETLPEALEREIFEETGLDLDILKNYEVAVNNLNDPWYIDSDPSSDMQNVNLRFGCFVQNLNKLPKLTTENNEVRNEVEEALWIPIKQIENYKWAFNHYNIINEFLNTIGFIK